MLRLGSRIWIRLNWQPLTYTFNGTYVSVQSSKITANADDAAGGARTQISAVSVASRVYIRPSG